MVAPLRAVPVAATPLMALGGAVIRNAARPLTPWAVAMMWLKPAATPVATPLALSMVAVLVLLDDQVKLTPVTMRPSASLATAVNASVEPACTVGDAACTVMLATRWELRPKLGLASAEAA
jgi:hypothetical protein